MLFSDPGALKMCKSIKIIISKIWHQNSILSTRVREYMVDKKKKKNKV